MKSDSFFPGDRVYSAVFYASLRTKTAGDKFITDSQSTILPDIKSCHGGGERMFGNALKATDKFVSSTCLPHT
jgi:hypothetical protein